MEIITRTKDRRLEAHPVDGGDEGEYVAVVARAKSLRSASEIIWLTRPEIAALAAKFPVEGKPVDPGVLEACREMLAAIEIEGADSARFFDARNSALTAIAAAEGK